MTTVLVIDDEDDVRGVIVKYLEFHKFDILQTASGTDGIDLARRHRPDLIICDISMPELTGFEILARLRPDSTTSHIPFIFLTGSTDLQTFRTGMELGADDFLTKPFRGDALIKAIRSRLERLSSLKKHYARGTHPLRPEEELLAEDLRAGLVSGDLTVHYQPQVEIATERILGAEALVRWNHPQRGMLLPASFIPLAEKIGVLRDLEEFVLGVAIARSKHWFDVLPTALRVAVNLSAEQFNNPDIVSIVAKLLDESGLPPHLLELELTESMLMQNPDESVGAMQKLKALGVHLSIDDFGTGYSSLNYLKGFPFDTLKVDRSFVQDSLTNSRAAEITHTIIELALRLQLRVIAEGVETKPQLDYVRSKGCHQAQGFYYSRAVPAALVEQLVRGELALKSVVTHPG